MLRRMRFGDEATRVDAPVFLDINGWLVTDPEMRLYDAMIAISSRALDKRGLAEVLRELAVPDTTRDESA